MSENIVKQACNSLSITLKELADEIGYGEDAVKKASATGTVSTPMSRAIELFLKTKELEKENNSTTQLKTLLRDFIK